jgi:hypothetical protein
MEETKNPKQPERQMEKVLRHRAKSMVAFVKAKQSDKERLVFFTKCLEAHHLDVLRDQGRTL